MKKIIVILGRGESLKKLADFNKKVDTIILINAFWKHKNFEKSYFDDEIIHNFIKDKKIYLVCTSSQKFTNINTLLDNYNVVECYKTKFSSYKRIGKDDNIFKIMPDSVLKKYIEIDKLEIKKSGDAIPGSLAYGCLLATEELKFKNIYIFGQDFYEKDYYIKNTYNKTGPNILNEFKESEINIFKNDITNFLKHLQNNNFYIFTCANYNPNINNIIIC